MIESETKVKVLGCKLSSGRWVEIVRGTDGKAVNDAFISDSSVRWKTDPKADYKIFSEDEWRHFK